MKMMAAVSEIFPTRQGEGPYTGEEQIFVRLAGCPLRCDYCDTPGSLTTKGHPRLSVRQVLEEVRRIRDENGIKTVSITGGEPLAHVLFLTALFPALKKDGFRIYLETAGVHPSALRQVVDWCDVIAMDIKLPSATQKEFWKEHARFLEIGGRKIFVKIVVEASSRLEEFKTAIRLVHAAVENPTVVIQPVTPVDDRIQTPNASQLSSFLETAREVLSDVRVMKQMHKEWGIR